MADYPISKEAVQKMLIDLRNSLGNERYISIGISMALHQLEGFPQMDAVEVVRCRECKYCSTFRMNGIDYPLCMIADKVKTPDGFCDEGVKRDAKED